MAVPSNGPSLSEEHLSLKVWLMKEGIMTNGRSQLSLHIPLNVPFQEI